MSKAIKQPEVDQVNTAWQTKKLGEVCEIINGGTPKTSVPEYWNGKHLWITPAEMGKRHSPFVNDTERKITDFGLKDSSAQLLPPYSVILSSRAPIGHLVINTAPMATNQGCKGLVPKNGLDSEYLYYYLGSIVDFLNSLGTGATFKEISGGKLQGVSIPTPPVGVQKCVVKILDEVFVKTAKAKENAEKNLQNARELFESYLENIFANPGEGWEEKMLEEIGETQTGTTPKTVDKENYGNHIPFITPADIDISGDGTIRYREEGLSEKGLENGRKMKTNSILMVCIGASIGKVGFVDRDVSCNQQINSLTVKKGFRPKFFYYALSTKGFFEKVIKNSAQATLPIINKGKWEKLTISYPSSEKEQQSIVGKLDALLVKTKKLEAIYQQKLANLEELKKSTLQKAFNGELAGAKA